MCPDPHLLSIYIDEELPSPWKEKMEKHLSDCSVCKEKFENLKQLQELFKKDMCQHRTIVELAERNPEGTPLTEKELMEAAREKVWKKLASKRHIRPNKMQRRRLHISLPAAAAAIVAIMLLTVAGLRIGFGSSIFSSQTVNAGFLVAAEEEMPGIMPAADITSILQFLNANGSDIIILQLPESSNFSRYGEPAVIRAADYTRRQPSR